ncbi:MAG: hypothetical protein JNK74_19065 [Candidatus Hydrogenedentes bacterium]|nr:hypothetical protein [Candidatus Hydrogenedentota bacterium]
MEIILPEHLKETSGDIAITGEIMRPYKRLTGFRQWDEDRGPVKDGDS